MDLQFQEITAEKLGEMMPYYSMRHNKTCDSVFLESFIWKEFYHVQYAIWEGKAVVWLMKNDGEYFSAMPLCREEDLPGAFDAIERYFNETLGRPLVIHLADEYAVQYLNLPEERYLVEEQPDAKDYLYEGNALRNLPGKKLHKKKNRVNAFKKAYEGRYEYRRLCCSDSFDVWQFLDKWRQQKGEDVEEHLDYEVRGIHDILKNCSDLYVRMGGVYIDEKLEAFTIGSYNPVEDMAVIHIEKANPEVNGLYQYINQQFLLEEFPEAAWVNREDDLGLEGLRKAKMSYMPADFARKYLVKQRTDLICFLEGEEKKATVPLWKTCFTEDSDSFVEYYYREKTKENRILVKQKLEAVKRADDERQNSVDVDPASADGKVLSMVHLNPYQLRMQEQEWMLDYLVAVATDPAERRKGHVRELFEKLLHQEASEGKPVTYLVPANPELAEMVGLTPQDRNYYRGMVRLSEIIKEGTIAGDKLAKGENLTAQEKETYEKAYSRYVDLSIMRQADAVKENALFEEMHELVKTGRETGKIPGYENVNNITEIISKTDEAEKKIHDPNRNDLERQNFEWNVFDVLWRELHIRMRQMAIRSSSAG